MSIKKSSKQENKHELTKNMKNSTENEQCVGEIGKISNTYIYLDCPKQNKCVYVKLSKSFLIIIPN